MVMADLGKMLQASGVSGRKPPTWEGSLILKEIPLNQVFIVDSERPQLLPTMRKHIPTMAKESREPLLMMLFELI